MTIVAQIQNLRSFITTQLPDVIDWNKHVRDDPLKKTTGDIAYVEIVTPFNRYKLAMGSAYADPPSGAPDQCRQLGWVTFQHVGEDKYLLAPKNDLTYRDIEKHIHVRELTDSLAQSRREIAEASDPQVAQISYIRMRELATKAERWGIKTNVPESPVSHHVNALPNGPPAQVEIRAPSPDEKTTEIVEVKDKAGHVISRLPRAIHEMAHPAPFAGAPIIYYCADRIAGMDQVPGILIRIQADGRAALQLFADLNEIQFKDNIHRRGSDAGNGRVHQTNCWDFNPVWLADHEKPIALLAKITSLEDEAKQARLAFGALLLRVEVLEAKPKRGRPPKSEGGETEGAEMASELRDDQSAA